MKKKAKRNESREEKAATQGEPLPIESALNYDQLERLMNNRNAVSRNEEILDGENGLPELEALPKSVQKTYEMHVKGATNHAIVLERKCRLATVYSHLAKAVCRGHPLNCSEINIDMARFAVKIILNSKLF